MRTLSRCKRESWQHFQPMQLAGASAEPQGAIDKGVFSTAPSGKNPGPPNLNAVLTAAQQLASAMTYLHEVHNITHGDLTGDVPVWYALAQLHGVTHRSSPVSIPRTA